MCKIDRDRNIAHYTDKTYKVKPTLIRDVTHYVTLFMRHIYWKLCHLYHPGSVRKLSLTIIISRSRLATVAWWLSIEVITNDSMARDCNPGMLGSPNPELRDRDPGRFCIGILKMYLFNSFCTFFKQYYAFTCSLSRFPVSTRWPVWFSVSPSSPCFSLSLSANSLHTSQAHS